MAVQKMFKQESFTRVWYVQCEREPGCFRSRSHAGHCILAEGAARVNRTVEQIRAEKLGRSSR